MRNWKHTLQLGDVFNKNENPEDDLIPVVTRVEEFYMSYPEYNEELYYIMEELIYAAYNRDLDEFNSVWMDFYNWADANDVWVQAW